MSQAETAEILGVSERTFRRRRCRYEADGAEGLHDRRLGRVSARRAPVDEVARVLALFDTCYRDYTAKHFHEKLVADHGCTRSYNWVRLTLQARRRMRAAPRRGAARRQRPRRALPGMMVHQDGSRHAWVPGREWDLIVTMDDTTSEILSATSRSAATQVCAQAATAMLNRTAGPNWLKAWALRLAKLRGKKRATVPLARRIGVVLHRMWRDSTEFRFTREEAMAPQTA